MFSQAIIFIPIVTLLLLFLMAFAISVIPVIIEIVFKANFLSIRRAFASMPHVRYRSHFLRPQSKRWRAMLLGHERGGLWLFVVSTKEVESLPTVFQVLKIFYFIQTFNSIIVLELISLRT